MVTAIVFLALGAGDCGCTVPNECNCKPGTCKCAVCNLLAQCHSYEEMLERSKAENKPCVTFYNQPARPVKGALWRVAITRDGTEKVVVRRPCKNGKCPAPQTLKGTPSKSEILACCKPKRRPRRMQTFMPPMMGSFGGGCVGGG